MGEHVQQEQELAVADPRQTRSEPAGSAALVFGPDSGLVALPVLAVGRIGDQVIKALVGMTIVGKRAAERDVVGVAAGWVLHEEVRLRYRPGLGVGTSCPKRWISAFGLIGGPKRSPFFRSPTVMC